MVGLGSDSSIDWFDSSVNPAEAEVLKSKSPKAKMLSREDPIQLSSLAQFG